MIEIDPKSVPEIRDLTAKLNSGEAITPEELDKIVEYRTAIALNSIENARIIEREDAKAEAYIQEAHERTQASLVELKLKALETFERLESTYKVGDNGEE